jgi:enterochelin esterase family protein
MAERFVIPTPEPGPFQLGPDSQRRPDVPCGVVTKDEWRSSIFPGTLRDYHVYVPAQYEAGQPANVMVFQDGAAYVDADGDMRVPIVFDNLIHQGRLPVTIGIFINPGRFPAVDADAEPISNRSFEYDTLSDQYARFLLDEMLPAVGDRYDLTDDPNRRAICGISSGGICAWLVAWERPDAFRKNPPKPIRVFLQAGANDLEVDWGNWALANLEMAAALQFAGYDYRLEYGDGGHDARHGGAILPESLLWLWR